MSDYKIRFPNSQRLQDLYEEACDCIENGEFFSTMHRAVSCNRASGIWRLACMDMDVFQKEGLS